MSDLDDEELKATRKLNGSDTREHRVYAIKFAVMQKQIDEKDKEIKKLKKHNKELLRKLRNRVKEVKKLNKYSLYKKEFKTLNLQLKNKDKMVDLMAECIDVELSSARLGIILNKNVKPLETYKEEIKQYFKIKAEKE